MLSLAILIGIWTTACIQTQISNVAQGYVRETYAFEKTGDFEFRREWYQDSKCSDLMDTETESGTIELGSKLQGIFIPQNTYEANFNVQSGVDLGAVTINTQYIRIARGVKNSTMRNTMLSLFEFKKNN